MARAETRNIVVRYPIEQHEAVKAAAARAGLSLNSFIVSATVQVAIGAMTPINTPAAPALRRPGERQINPVNDAAIAAVQHALLRPERPPAIEARARIVAECKHPMDRRRGFRCTVCDAYVG